MLEYAGGTLDVADVQEVNRLLTTDNSIAPALTAR